MTVRVTTLKGPEAGSYYVDGLPRYYLDAGEPPGVWFGNGISGLGLDGEVDAEDFLALMAGRHLSTGARLGWAYGERSVRGYDVTCSAPKSVSVLWAIGDEAVRAAVVAAHDAAVGEVVGFIDGQAHTRISVAGEVVVVDTSGISAALFRQHTSRTRDPQLHTHAVVIAKVQAPTGGWRALDGRMAKFDQRSLSAIYHAGLRAELTRRLGAAWHKPDNGIAEMRGVPQPVLDRFSERTAQVELRVADKLARFRTTMGRPPTPRERWRLEREAVRDSRPAKPKPADAAVLHAEWQTELRALAIEPADLVAAVVGRNVLASGLDQAEQHRMATMALATLAEGRSTWRRNDLIRELARAVPTTVTLPADRLVQIVERLADEVIGECLVDLGPPVPALMPRRRDGRPITESTLDRRLTLPAILAEEEQLVVWATARWATSAAPNPRLHAPDLDRAQLAVARAVAGSEALVVVVGPAGAGKTTSLRAAVEQLRAEGRTAFGLAPSATAAGVLAAETGVAADTIDKLLFEHQRPSGPSPDCGLGTGATVIVDEASMVATAKMARLVDLADRHKWRVVLLGDPYQLSAVERGGMFAHLVDIGPTVALERMHRFTADWERQASLRLRRGDPDVLAVYEQHGRLHDGLASDMETAIVSRWSFAQSAGEDVAVIATRTDTVARLNQLAQAHRIAAGELDALRWVNGRDDCRLQVGERIATRANTRRLRTDRGVMVKNRARWHIEAIHPDGSVIAAGRDGRVTLPGVYVAAHVELGYAETAHASQGRTVDRSLLVVDGPTDGRAVYVALTRGRHSNEAFVITDDDRTARDILAELIARDWVDPAAVAVRGELAARLGQHLDRHPAVGRPQLGTQVGSTPLDPAVLRELLAERFRLRGLNIDGRRSDVRNLQAADTGARHQLADLHGRHRDALERAAQWHHAAEEGPAWRWRERAEAKRQAQRAEHDASALATEADHIGERITRRQLRIDSARTWLSDHRPHAETLQRVTAILDLDAAARAERAAADADSAAARFLGRRPEGNARNERSWDRAAGLIEQYRTAAAITDPDRAPEPQPDEVAVTWLVELHRTAIKSLQDVQMTQRMTVQQPQGRGLDLGL